MKGPWHYKEAERLGQLATDRSERLAKKGVMVASQAEVEQRTISQFIALAQVHATLAAAASNTVHAFFDDDEPSAWAAAFASGGVEAEPSCRLCGCTPNRACKGGCSWVSDPFGPVCSACVMPAPATPGYAGDDEQGTVLPVAEAGIVEAEQGQMFQAYERNRAQGRDPVESAARAIVGLT